MDESKKMDEEPKEKAPLRTFLDELRTAYEVAIQYREGYHKAIMERSPFNLGSSVLEEIVNDILKKGESGQMTVG